MHFSKSAGLMMKRVLRMHARVKLDVAEEFNIDCHTLYHKYRRSRMYSRENALFPGFGVHNEPILCDNFIYIVPIREPIERICSQTSQFVSAPNHQRFLKKVKNSDNFQRKSCVDKWTIDGIDFE
eukprot:355136_1